MKVKFTRIAALILLICLSAFTSCFEDEPEEKFTVKVICSGTNFDGYIMPDNDGIATYTGTDIGSSTYYYEATYEGLSSVFVSTTINAGIDATINIFIYREDNKVKEATLTVTAATTSRTLTLSYEVSASESTK